MQKADAKPRKALKGVFVQSASLSRELSETPVTKNAALQRVKQQRGDRDRELEATGNDLLRLDDRLASSDSWLMWRNGDNLGGMLSVACFTVHCSIISECSTAISTFVSIRLHTVLLKQVP